MEALEGFIKEPDMVHFAFYYDSHDCHVWTGVEGTQLETVRSSILGTI